MKGKSFASNLRNNRFLNAFYPAFLRQKRLIWELFLVSLGPNCARKQLNAFY